MGVIVMFVVCCMHSMVRDRGTGREIAYEHDLWKWDRSSEALFG